MCNWRRQLSLIALALASSKVTLQIVASLIDAARGVIYDRHMFIVQATGVPYITVNGSVIYGNFFYDTGFF